MKLIVPSPLEKVSHPLFNAAQLNVFIKRDDEIHPDISGNKWRKLKFNIEKFKQGKYDKILTFGGAYSNHIAAMAYLGKALDIPTIGFIRGEELNSDSNDTLINAAKCDMNLQFVSREIYQYRYEKWYWEELRNTYGNILIIPEGGANFLGLLGCAEIMNELPSSPDYIISAAGTGTTISGLLYHAQTTKVIGVPVFKKGGFIKDEVRSLLLYSGLSDEELNEKMERLILETRFHFGGYGKHTDELITFINTFYNETGIRLDQVYTAKMVYALMAMVKENHFRPGENIVMLHTGGLQGLSSIKSSLNL